MFYQHFQRPYSHCIRDTVMFLVKPGPLNADPKVRTKGLRSTILIKPYHVMQYNAGRPGQGRSQAEVEEAAASSDSGAGHQTF